MQIIKLPTKLLGWSYHHLCARGWDWPGPGRSRWCTSWRWCSGWWRGLRPTSGPPSLRGTSQSRDIYFICKLKKETPVEIPHPLLSVFTLKKLCDGFSHAVNLPLGSSERNALNLCRVDPVLSDLQLLRGSENVKEQRILTCSESIYLAVRNICLCCKML